MYPVSAWVMFGVIWGLAVIGITLNAIDLKKFHVLSLVCYLGMGWCVVFRIRQTIEAVGINFFLLLFAGGIFYTVGAGLYVAGKKKKYMHSVFHIFVDIAALLHFLAIVIYIMPG
jgi:hemolysin III